MLIPIDIERTLRAIREAFRDLASPQDPDFEARLEAAAAEGGLVDARGAAPEEYIEPLPSVLRLRPPLPAMTPDEVIAYDLLARHWFSRARLAEEAAYALSAKPAKPEAHILARTFGRFDLLVDGKAISFKQAKCKELLAYLVDRRGSSVTRAEAFAILWGDRLYDRPMQKQFDVIIRSLRDTLRENGVEGILEIRGGTMRICTELIQCDLFRFCSGDVNALNAYRGEYMNGYTWASMTESYMTWQYIGSKG